MKNLALLAGLPIQFNDDSW